MRLGALAQEFPPKKSVTMVVGFAAGGAADTAARIIAKKLGDNLGVAVVIDNRPGAAGNLATEIVIKSNDGATLLVASNPYINKALYKMTLYKAQIQMTR